MTASAAQTSAKRPLVAPVGRPKNTDYPPEVAERAKTELLLSAIWGDRHNTVVPFDGGIHLRCVRCRYIGFGLPSARMEDRWRWECFKCGATGTRYELERLVLESPDAVLRLLAIVNDREP